MSGRRRESGAPIRKLLLGSFILFFSAVTLLGVVRTRTLLGEYAKGEEVYAELNEYVAPKVPEPTPRPSDAPQPQEPEESQPAGPRVDFPALREINSDIVGWIAIDGTGINYPIVQTGDNDYYLTHLFSGEVNRSGCIFLDCRNHGDFSDANSVIYGHHLKNGTMFSELLEYKKQEFYDEHPTAWLATPEGEYEVKFFAGYVSDVWGEAWEMSFPSQEEFARWLTRAAERSAFSGGPTPTAEDRILTLSTCSYEFSDARFVLLGILEEKG